MSGALERYTQMLAHNPDNELAPSAKYELDNLGKETADLIPQPQQSRIAKKKR